MRLRRLETFGFKSFADRMTFDFEDGVTAIIGPNGCGKSNVVDAIKWVLGEQSAKALRGSEMADVIFNGCATRRGMALSEVTLVLDQVSAALGVEGDEVAITRRLTRDGISSYFLNGKPCRLKDIRELFLGTGMGTSAYAVIEQGRVGFILESNTKDRRLILEEAAGISRYKQRRRIAERKLERVELDLQRIGEVLAEVRRRARAVRRQAEAALRWKEISGEVKELRLAFALDEWGRQAGERATAARAAEEAAARRAEAAASLGGIEASLAEDEARMLEHEGGIRAVEQERAEIQARGAVAAARLDDAAGTAAGLDRQEGEDRAFLDQLHQRLAAAAAQREAAEAAILAAGGPTAGDTALDQRVATARAAADAAVAEVDRRLAKVEELKGQQVEALRDLARVDAEAHAVEAAHTGVDDRRRRLEERSGGQVGQLATASTAEIQARAAVEAAVRAAAEAHLSLDEAIRASESAQSEVQRLEHEQGEVRHQDARAETALRLLQEAERRAEGVSRGVRDVLAEVGRLPGVVGMVADLCRVQDEHVLAIETALGGQAQNIITETQDDARSAVEFLKRERSGRATFLPLDDIEGGERVDEAVLRRPGVVGLASRLVSFDARLRPAFEFLLGNVVVVGTLDDAIRLRRERPGRIRIVSLEGDHINPGGAISGGRQGGPEGGLVSRKAEIRRHEEQRTELTRRREELAGAIAAGRAEMQAQARRVEAARAAISQADRAAGEARAQLMKAERDRMHLEQAASGFGAELEEIAAELSRLETDARDLAGQKDWFGALVQRLGDGIAAAQGEVEAAAAARDRAQEELSALRVQLATVQERIEAARNHLAHCTRAVQELEDQRDAARRRLAELDSRRGELARARLEHERAREAATAALASAADRLDDLVVARDRLRNGAEVRRQEARALAAQVRAAEQEQAQAERTAGEAGVRLEALAARVRDDHGLDLAAAHAEWVAAGKDQEAVDWEALRGRLQEREKELAALGPVNLAAIDELAEAEAREGFLDKQFTDLERARDRLKEIIAQLDGVSRRLFEDTYRQVRKNFQDLFRKLFGGGRADLELEKTDEQGNPVDVLDAGLEIVASPPGKNPKVITQLSGGEKALTAIALLFAVYRTKPSPFCVLDEVDAPLDDSNVDVYNTMVREFVRGFTRDDGSLEHGGSQFIVITHKKRTMQRADAIYGITQNEAGVSTKISVKFAEVDQLGDLAPAKRGSGPFTTAAAAVGAADEA